MQSISDSPMIEGVSAVIFDFERPIMNGCGLVANMIVEQCCPPGENTLFRYYDCLYFKFSEKGFLFTDCNAKQWSL